MKSFNGVGMAIFIDWENRNRKTLYYEVQTALALLEVNGIPQIK